MYSLSTWPPSIYRIGCDVLSLTESGTVGSASIYSLLATELYGAFGMKFSIPYLLSTSDTLEPDFMSLVFSIPYP